MSDEIKTTALGRIGGAAAKAAAYAMMLLFTAMTLYPIFWLIMNSFKSTREFQVSQLAFPREPTLSNYVEAWNRITSYNVCYTKLLRP